METSCRRITTSRRSRSVITMALVGLVLLTSLDTVSGVPYKRSLLRLCSTSLSDALKLLCQKTGGYNEAFSYNEDDSSQDSYAFGPGLADECCYHTCTMTQLMEYCKPEPPTTAKAAATITTTTVKDSSRMLNLPFPATNTDEDDASSKERSRLRSTGAEELQAGSDNGDIEHERDLLKCKNQRSTRIRKHRINNAREDDEGEKRTSDLSGGQPHFRRKSTYPRRRMRPPAKTLGRRLIAKSAPEQQRRGHEPLPCSRRSARPLRSKRKGIVVRKARASSKNLT